MELHQKSSNRTGRKACPVSNDTHSNALWLGTTQADHSFTTLLTDIFKQTKMMEGASIQTHDHDQSSSDHSKHFVDLLETNCNPYFQKLFQQGFLEQKEGLCPWCSHCNQPLSKLESTMTQVQDPTCIVSFPIISHSTNVLLSEFHLCRSDETHNSLQSIEFLSWTSKPWSLIANEAIVINPEIDYLCFTIPLLSTHRCFIVASDLFSSTIEKISTCERNGTTNSETTQVTLIGAPIKGSQIASKAILVSHPVEDRGVPLILCNTVKQNMGTGVLHIAPACSPIDLQIAQTHNVTSSFTPVNGFQIPIQDSVFKLKEASQYTLQLLTQSDRLLAQNTITHLQPLCPYCKEGRTVYKKTSQWVIPIHKLPLHSLMEEIKNDAFQINPKRYKKILLSQLQEWSEEQDWVITMNQSFRSLTESQSFTPLFVQSIARLRPGEFKESFFISAFSNIPTLLSTFLLEKLLKDPKPTENHRKKKPSPQVVFLHCDFCETNENLTLRDDLSRLWLTSTKFTNDVLTLNSPEVNEELSRAQEVFQHIQDCLSKLQDLHDHLMRHSDGTQSPDWKNQNFSQMEKYLLTEVFKTNTKLKISYQNLDLNAVFNAIYQLTELCLSWIPLLNKQITDKQSTFICVDQVLQVMRSMTFPILPTMLARPSLSQRFLTTKEDLLGKQEKFLWTSFFKLKDLIDQKRNRGEAFRRIRLLAPQKESDQIKTLLETIALDFGESLVDVSLVRDYLQCEMELALTQEKLSALKQAVLFD